MSRQDNPFGDKQGFLARWSQVKSDSRKDKDVPVELIPPSPAQPAQTPCQQEMAGDPAADVLDSLPPLDALDAQSDFRPFMGQGVPDSLKSQALAKLWRSDPVLSAMDSLDLHNLDYTFPAIPEIVETAWDIGRGFAAALDSPDTVPVLPPGQDEQKSDMLSEENKPEDDFVGDRAAT